MTIGYEEVRAQIFVGIGKELVKDRRQILLLILTSDFGLIDELLFLLKSFENL